MAAAVGATEINNVQDLAVLCRKICGSVALGNAVTLSAVIGACIVAAIVVMLCAAWVIEDIVKIERLRSMEPRSQLMQTSARALSPAFWSGFVLDLHTSL